MQKREREGTRDISRSLWRQSGAKTKYFWNSHCMFTFSAWAVCATQGLKLQKLVTCEWWRLRTIPDVCFDLERRPWKLCDISKADRLVGSINIVWRALKKYYELLLIYDSRRKRFPTINVACLPIKEPCVAAVKLSLSSFRIDGSFRYDL